MRRVFSSLSRARLPKDVDPTTGLCACGSVRIAEAAGKGLGAFAARPLEPADELGEYSGELLTMADYRARYGTTDASAWVPPDDDEWHAQWSAQRRRRGVGATGQYVLQLTSDAYLDAEDPMHANWTRFINHSDSPNLIVERGDASARFIVQQCAATGDELTFMYSAGYARWIEKYCR